MFKSNLIFDVLGNILKDKSIQIFKTHIQNNNWSTVSKFLLLRYLSMSPCAKVRDVVIDNYIVLEHMPEKSLYRWLIDNIPQQRNTFIKYIK